MRLFESVEIFEHGFQWDHRYIRDDPKTILGSCAFVPFRILLRLPTNPQPSEDKRLSLNDFTNSTIFRNSYTVMLPKNRVRHFTFAIQNLNWLHSFAVCELNCLKAIRSIKLLISSQKTRENLWLQNFTYNHSHKSRQWQRENLKKTGLWQRLQNELNFP
jgi:hypothetical protein